MVAVDQIKKLRELTGAGITDCRQALEETSGDVTAARELLKKQGIENAAKKAKRETRQGKVFSYVHSGRIGVILSLLCETDFVAKTDEFQDLGKELALQIASMDPKDESELLTQEYIRDPKLNIDALVKSTIGKLGENIRIGKFYRLSL